MDADILTHNRDYYLDRYIWWKIQQMTQSEQHKFIYDITFNELNTLSNIEIYDIIANNNANILLSEIN